MADVVYSKEQVELWQKNLEEIALEPRTTFTKKQVVEELIDTIEKALLTRSYDEVATGLKDWGLEITAGSLKQYVTRYRRANPSKASANSRKRSDKARQKKRAAGAAAKASQATTTEREKETSENKQGDHTKPARFIGMEEEDL